MLINEQRFHHNLHNRLIRSIHAGKMLTYTAIIRAVWGYSDYGSIKKLQVNMKNIRKMMSNRKSDRLWHHIISTLSKYLMRISAQFSAPSLEVSRIM